MERELWWIKIAVKDGNPELLDCMCMAHSHLQDACTFDCSTPEGQFFFFLFFPWHYREESCHLQEFLDGFLLCLYYWLPLSNSDPC